MTALAQCHLDKVARRIPRTEKSTGYFSFQKSEKGLDKSRKMCGRFQQRLAENGPCNEKVTPVIQIITRRMHSEYTSRKAEKTIEKDHPRDGPEQRRIHTVSGEGLHPKAKTGLWISYICSSQYEWGQYRQQFNGLFQV